MKLTELLVSSLYGSSAIIPFTQMSLSGNTSAADLASGLAAQSYHDHHKSNTSHHAKEPLTPQLLQGPTLRFHVKSRHRSTRIDQCPEPPVLSCSPQAATTDSCCVVNPGGILLHAQFWDLDVGQADSWGIHGLW